MFRAETGRRARQALVCIASVVLASACSNDSPTDPGTPLPPAASPFTISGPLPGPSVAPAHVLLGPPSGSTVTYVSLMPGSIPSGTSASILVARSGYTVSVSLVAGGFDPVAVPALVGDTVSIKVQFGGGSQKSYMRTVPASTNPVVVRTDPPAHKRDVPLNTRMLIVFSEPIDTATLDTASVQLWRQSKQVTGQVLAGDPAHLTATFLPEDPLTALAVYELRVTEDIAALDGHQLNAPVSVPFTTQAASSAPLYTVGGWVYGLAGSDLVLLNSGTDPLTVEANGSFTFPTAIANGAPYQVTVFAQPTTPDQTCSVSNGSGTAIDSDVTSVGVFCTTVITGNLVFASVSAGLWHNCGVTTTGAAYCWGENWSGALGNGTTSNSAVPVAVAGGLTFASVSAGFRYTCGVTTAGALYCWGGNEMLPFSTGGDASPTLPIPVAPGLTFASVSTGDSHVCGLTPAGAAYCWGDGILAVGGVPDTIGFLAVPGGLTFADVSAGFWHTCGVTTAGGAYCWGANLYGELGTYDHLAAGATWGPDDCVNLNRAGDTLTLPCSRVPVAIAGGLAFREVDAGVNTTCGLTTSGAAYCWGSNGNGWQGVGEGPDDCWTPCTFNPLLVSTGLSFASLSSGGISTCAITSVGSAYCWGVNGYGELGDGTTVDRTSPVAVAGGLSFAMVSAHRDGGGASTCGVTTGGVAYCWGYNAYGQLGTGEIWSSSVPVKVAFQP